MADGTDTDVDDVRVDLDLDAEDARLREAIGEPTSIRLAGKVIKIDHASSWNDVAMRCAARGDWNGWAEEVIQDDDQLDTFISARLANYQIEAVFEQCGKQGQVDMGKSRRPNRSSTRTRRQ